VSIIPFGKWAPDASDLAGDVVPDIDGVLPGPNCKLPWPGPVAAANPVGATVYGAVYVKAYTYDEAFCGTATALYKLNKSTRVWEDVTNASTTYSASAAAPWRFRVYNGDVIAVHAGAAPQYFTLGSSTDFDDVANAPTGSLVEVWGDHLVIGGVTGTRNRVHASDINDKETWSPLATNNAFLQDFADGGAIMGLSGSRSPLIVQERMLRRATLVGGVSKVRFDTLANGVGTDFADSVVNYGNGIYMLGLDGFLRIDESGGIEPIGQNYVDDWVRDSESVRASRRIIGCPDTRHRRVYWALHYTSTTVPDTLIVYDIMRQEWSKATLNVYELFQLPLGALILDDIDTNLDDIDYSFDSPDNNFYVAAFDSDMKPSTFTGTPLAATIYTNQFPKRGGNRTRLQGAMPSIDTNAATVTVRKKDRRGDAFADGSTSVAVNDAGWCPLRDSGRYFRLKMDVPAGTTWTKAEGVEAYTQEEGVY
jgi:hypothetical protein